MKRLIVEEIPVYRRVPFLRLLLPCMAGIVLVDIGWVPDPVYLQLVLTLLLIATAFMVRKRLKKPTEKYVGILSTITWVLIGSYFYVQRSHPVDTIDHCAGRQVTVSAEVIERSSTAKGWKLECRLGKVLLDGKLYQQNGRFLVRGDTASGFGKLNAGDKLLLVGTFKKIPGPDLPHGFDYAALMRRKGIFFQFQLQRNGWSRREAAEVSAVTAFIDRQRLFLEQQLHRFIPGEEAQNVAIALLIGDDDAIDQELMQSYSTTGTLHVLSVSGMHVGLIYLLIATLLKPLEKRRRWRPLYFVLVILLIWCYAILAACSPPVLRSALMLTIALVGKWLHRKSALLNSIVISLFFLLLKDPSLLFNTGLQLSYLAVTGIVWLQPRIAAAMHFSNPILHWLYEFFSVSVAAQATTVGISLLMFHQFPDLFLFANIVVIPLSTVAIYASIAVCVVSGFPVVATIAGNIAGFFIDSMNAIVNAIASSSLTATTGIQISLFDCIVIYILLYALSGWLQQRKYSQLLLSSIAIILLQSSALVRTINRQTTEHIFATKISGNQVVIHHSGTSLLITGTSIDSLTTQKINKQLQQYAAGEGVVRIMTVYQEKKWSK